MLRIVILPVLSRPPLFLTEVNKLFSGTFVVISELSVAILKR
jgi:hypothetical protein